MKKLLNFSLALLMALTLTACGSGGNGRDGDAQKGGTYIIMEPLLVATAIYFCLCFPTSKLIAYAERRMRRGDVR